MSEIRALLFDMDGVVIDSNPLHRDAWAAYNLRHGIHTTAEMCLRISGKRNDEVVRDFFGPDLDAITIAAHGRDKEALYRTLMRDRLAEAIVPGIEDFLARRAGIDAALVTNAEPANVDFVLDGSGLRHCFRAVVTGDDVARPKPHPDIYLRTADILGVRPTACVVFEDSPVGVAAARAAGMYVIGVSTSDAYLEGAAVMIADFRDPALEAWLSPRL